MEEIAPAIAEARVKVARLIEWLTLGAGVPGCMHGGGSPDAAKLVIRTNADLERCVSLAKRLVDLEEEIVEPEPVKKR